MIDIEDIARALSRICRFTGHTSAAYSVAQHSVYVSHVAPEKYALQGLLHDAAEAYLGDVSSPLKQLLPDYKVIEQRVEQAICARFGLPFPLHPTIKKADLRMLVTERREFMPAPLPHLVETDAIAWSSFDGVKALPWNLQAWDSDAAYTSFMLRFKELS
jgi:hypothetical protein